ncbi:MAG: hypothetical protein ACE5ES_05790 [Candidatus Nanoarchaeia archaeon]
MAICYECGNKFYGEHCDSCDCCGDCGCSNDRPQSNEEKEGR